MNTRYEPATACPEPERLERAAAGLADEADLALVLGHATSCADCSRALVALSLAENPGTAQEEALVARALAAPARPLPLPLPAPIPLRPARSRWAVRVAGAAAAIACAAGVGLVFVAEREPPDAALLALATDSRPTEGRLSAGFPHAPYRPTRGAHVAAGPYDAILADLLERKAQDPAGTARALAALYVRRGEPGDLARAEDALRAAAAGPELDNDRAVLLLAQGRAEEALQALRSAVALRKDFPAARFNLAVALETLGRRADAARALRDYLAVADVAGPEAPWVAEARERLVRLEQSDR